MRPRRESAPLLLGWTLGIGLVVGLAVYGVQSAAARLIEQDAEHAAYAHLHKIVEGVPDMARLLGGEAVDERVLEHLRLVARMGTDFRFRLFGADGAEVLASSELARARDPSSVPRTALGSYLSSEESRQLLRLEQPLQRIVERPDARGQPRTYVEAFVPVRVGSTFGVVEVDFDQTERVQRVYGFFYRVSAAVAGSTLLVGAALLLQVWLRRSERRRAELEMVRAARRDALSGALNRTALDAALQQAAGTPGGAAAPYALMYVDVDRFKDINDVHGNVLGDEVLRCVAARLRVLLGAGDKLARVGDDEFAILLTDLGSIDELLVLGRRILATFKAPVDAGGLRLRCSVTVGAACSGVHGASVDELVRNAGIAVSCAKSGGPGRFELYDAQAARVLDERRGLMHELRDAVASDQLVLHYQPLCDAGSGAVVGYEALMRWKHPTRGLVPPAVFIPLAEQADLIAELGTWALRSACREAVLWPAPLSVAVNLSARQFSSEPALEQVVARALADAGLPASRLELEITESLMLTDKHGARQVLRALSATGVRIVMDDFGTGYSSLAYLWRYPIQKLKLSGEFVQALEHAEQRATLVLGAIVKMAHAMGIRVNVEGIETETQRRAVTQLGCDELQGYLLGRPQPASALGDPGEAGSRH